MTRDTTGVYSCGHVTYVLAVNVRRSLVYDCISGRNQEEKEIIYVYCVFLTCVCVCVRVCV